MNVVPKKPLSRVVRLLCRDISRDKPVFLPYTDLGYQPQECHLNVRHRVKTHGGSVVNGWLIWDYEVFAEAEFHAVWRSLDGQLIDLTPRTDGEACILFLPDAKTRMLPGKAGGVLCPCNRTTRPAWRYVWQGTPWLTSTVENAFHPTVHAYAKSLGLDVYCVLQS